jgi:hypothetical protein
MEQIKPRRPKYRVSDHPDWWHYHGHKVRCIGIDSANSPTQRTLLFASNATNIRIHPDSNQKGWILEYRIRHSPESRTDGVVWMSTGDFETAFGLSSKCECLWGQVVIDSHGGEFAYQGRYIRSGQHLNIPGPGTAYDGDPNLSVLLSDDLKRYVRMFLELK